MLTKMQAGTYTEFITVFANVFLGMQLALSSYLQVCFSITNDVVMSISLMYEQPESGKSLIHFFFTNFELIIAIKKDLMARKPRNVRTERLTDWRFFFQIYLVNFFLFLPLLFYGIHLKMLSFWTVHWFDDVAVRYEHVVPLHVRTRSQVLRRDIGL